MPKSKNIRSGGLATFVIQVNGAIIPDKLQVYSIEIDQSVNKISKAKIVLIDGDPVTGTFVGSSSSTFVPGNKIVIKVGYDTNNSKVFEGIITKQEINIDNEFGSSLAVECKSEAIKMTVGRKSATFAEKTDADIISTILGQYPGFSSTVARTNTTWPEQVQYYTSDWDFIIARSQLNGLVVTDIGGHIEVAQMDRNPSPVLTAKYGDNIMGFHSELDAVTQLDNVSASAWDYKSQKVITGAANSQRTGPGNLSTKNLSKVIGLKEFDLQTQANLMQDDLSIWSETQILKSEYSKIRGRVKIHGDNMVLPTSFITLEGLGDRFNGDHFVSSVQHVIAQGNWVTEITFGMSPSWFTENTNVMAPPASGLLPGARGLFNATVKKMYDDPENQFRILIDIPMFDTTGEGIWARLSNFYSTNGAGAFFLPEVGDEVVIGFLNEDPRYPVILGSLYSNPKNQPFAGLHPNEQNSTKAIVSKSQIQIAFDDKNKILTINTPSNNTITLNDKNKEIAISDQNNNNVVMSSSGITIKSPKDIRLEAGGEVKINGDKGVDIHSKTNINTDSTNLSLKAKVKYEASGGLEAAIKAGAQLKLDAAMIMIN